MKTIFILAFVLAFSGCAQLAKVMDRSADSVAKGVNEYCENTDSSFRTQFRSAVNEKAAPDSIEVTCAE